MPRRFTFVVPAEPRGLIPEQEAECMTALKRAKVATSPGGCLDLMHRIALVLLLAGLVPCSALSAGDHDQSAVSTVVRTGKERLGDKASDEQRVDDCKVTPAKRTRSRPTNCLRR
jgi:hypothetical protein